MSDAGKIIESRSGTGGLESFKGYKPQPGERTLNNFVKDNAADAEIGLNTNSPGFNNNSRTGIGGQFKRFGADSHGGIDPHVHQPIRNPNTNTGEVFGSTGTKTGNGGVTYPAEKDVKQLYDYLFNGKY